MATSSLKGLITALAPVLGESESTLYERQRALVREGLLEAEAGHGPGSGVRATSESVAMLLVGMLASASLSEAGPSARLIAERATKPAPPCKLTRETRFVDALARVLSDESLAARVSVIRVAVTHGYASIEFDKARLTTFVGRMPKEGRLRIDVAIPSGTLRALAKIVARLEEPK
jgi:hypothetical protein